MMQRRMQVDRYLRSRLLELKHQQDTDVEEDLREAFNVFDKTGLGYITEKDMMAVFQQVDEDTDLEEVLGSAA